MKFRRVYVDEVVNPETGGLCEVEIPEEGASHDGPHCHTEWENGEIVGPIYWEDAP